jgi:ABC-type nitrate/sulfonate/bicarbonate transport system ATPase subunit
MASVAQCGKSYLIRVSDGFDLETAGSIHVNRIQKNLDKPFPILGSVAFPLLNCSR